MSNPSQPTAFTGTATYYIRYRPPYPDGFLSDLRSYVKTTGNGSLLDLACGPGRIAIPMAPFFKSVLAVDVESEMITVGQKEASRRGVSNISWLVERAENLKLSPRSVELITIGDAFHRLDQTHILKLAVRWLQYGGALVALGTETVWQGEEEWKRVLAAVVNKWTNQSLGDPNSDNWAGPCEQLRAAGLEVQEHESVVEQIWTCDSIVGFLYSTSIASQPVLGGSVRNFEAELREALLGFEPSDRFVSKQRFGFTLGIKHGDDGFS